MDSRLNEAEQKAIDRLLYHRILWFLGLVLSLAIHLYIFRLLVNDLDSYQDNPIVDVLWFVTFVVVGGVAFWLIWVIPGIHNIWFVGQSIVSGGLGTSDDKEIRKFLQDLAVKSLKVPEKNIVLDLMEDGWPSSRARHYALFANSMVGDSEWQANPDKNSDKKFHMLKRYGWSDKLAAAMVGTTRDVLREHGGSTLRKPKIFVSSVFGLFTAAISILFGLAGIFGSDLTILTRFKYIMGALAGIAIAYGLITRLEHMQDFRKNRR